MYGCKVIFHLCSFQIADSQLFFNQFLLIYKRVFCLVLFPISQCIMSLQKLNTFVVAIYDEVKGKYVYLDN